MQATSRVREMVYCSAPYKLSDMFGDSIMQRCYIPEYLSLSGVPDYFGRNKISSGGDLSHYSSASLY